MDVKALFPSITIKLAQEAIVEALTRSELCFIDIDTNMLMRYTALTTPVSKLRKLKLLDGIPKPKSRTTLASFSNNPKPSQFDPPKFHGPISQTQLRKILALAISASVELVMLNPFISIDGKNYIPEDGGSIGMDLTGEPSSLVKLLWDEKFCKLLKTLRLNIDEPVVGLQPCQYPL